MDELRKALAKVRDSAPYNAHAKALTAFCEVAAGVLESQAEQLATVDATIATINATISTLAPKGE